MYISTSKKTIDTHAWNHFVYCLNEYVSIQLLYSNKQKNVYKVNLRYQSKKGEERIIVYTRYITAVNAESAKKQAAKVVQIWLSKQTSQPANLSLDKWESILDAFE